MGQMMQVLGEAVDGQRVVKVYGGQEFEQSRFMRAAHGLRRNLVKQVSASSMNTGVTQLIVSVALAVIIYSAGLRAAEGSFSAGDFMSYLTAMIMLFTPVKRITTVTQILQRGLAAAESVFTLLDSPEETNQGRQTLTRARGELRFEQVGFRYPQGEREALEHITLHIRPGETVALVGSSGSGKTTLANLVPRFYDPQSGRLTLDGIPLPELELGNLRQQVAMVNQDVVLFNGTLADNIAYARPSASREEIVEAARAANAMEFISTLPEGFDTLIGENGTRLSGGQRQRIAIARALLRDSPVLLLDEATSALDTESERHIQAAIDELCKARTSLVIAHRLSTIEKADEILVIDEGHIVERGNHQTLMDMHGTYAQLRAIQFGNTATGNKG